MITNETQGVTVSYSEGLDRYVAHLDGHNIILPQEVVQALRKGLEETDRQEAKTSMEVQVTRHRWANMGDHAQLVQEAVKYDPTQTVESLVLEALDMERTFQRHDPMDHLTLRVVMGTEPERTPFVDPFE